MTIRTISASVSSLVFRSGLIIDSKLIVDDHALLQCLCLASKKVGEGGMASAIRFFPVLDRNRMVPVFD